MCLSVENRKCSLMVFRHSQILFAYFVHLFFSFRIFISTDTKIRVLPAKEWLTLECDNRTAGDKTVEWQKEKIDVRTVFAGKEDNVKIYENGTLALYFKEKEPEVPVFGNYTCNTTSSGNVTTRYRIVRK